MLAGQAMCLDWSIFDADVWAADLAMLERLMPRRGHQ